MLNVSIRPHRSVVGQFGAVRCWPPRHACAPQANRQRPWLIVCTSGPQVALGQIGGHVSFALYTLGFVIMIVGLIYGATLLHMPARWIVVGTVVLLGLGIVKAVKTTRQKDPAS